MGKVKIEEKFNDHTLNLCLDTIKLDKQSIVFVNTKRGAESQAEKLAAKTKDIDLLELSEKILNALPKPTKQCQRLANCVRKGAAFHHAGLHSKQRELIEENFRNRKIKVICATPTLAMGVDLPAYRVILRDLKRFTGRGMAWIPILEYEQMSGRAGRPSFDDHGEAICVAKTDAEADDIWEMYVEGEPEEIISKLAVEPVLRIYVLSLIATNFCNSRDSLYEFFDKTFYAHQYEDLYELHAIIDKMTDLLQEWEFVKGNRDDFVSGSEVNNDEKLEATLLGRRVSELYLDPYTANYIITCLRKAASKKATNFAWLHMLSSCLEMRPLLRVKQSEYALIQEDSLQYLDELFDSEPSEFDYEYESFLNAIKTSLFFKEWMDEKDEEFLMERFDIRPGEIQAKKDRSDWLLYATQELATLLKFQSLRSELAKVRVRINYGVKEELLPLLKLKNIGRVRSRKMFNNGIKDLGEVKKVDVTKLVQILGKKTAIDVKKQVGVKVDKIKVKENKRKGQINLKDYS